MGSGCHSTNSTGYAKKWCEGPILISCMNVVHKHVVVSHGYVFCNTCSRSTFINGAFGLKILTSKFKKCNLFMYAHKPLVLVSNLPKWSLYAVLKNRHLQSYTESVASWIYVEAKYTHIRWPCQLHNERFHPLLTSMTLYCILLWCHNLFSTQYYKIITL